MKAVQITEAGKVQVADIVKPTLGAGEILLRIKYVGFCGSDLNTYLGRNPMVKMPVIPGHEVGAVIEEIGEGVSCRFREGNERDCKSIYQLAESVPHAATDVSMPANTTRLWAFSVTVRCRSSLSSLGQRLFRLPASRIRNVH